MFYIGYIDDALLIVPRYTIKAGYYGFKLVVCMSVCLSYVSSQSVFLFPDDNLSQYQWIFTKLGVCIDNVEFWFGIAIGQISSIFDRVICSPQIHSLIS